MTSSVLDPANQDPSKEMQESYERERQPEFDQAVQDAKDLQGREKIDALSDAAKKRKLGERMFDSIESGVTGSVQWLQKQAEDDPNRYTDDVLRIFGGGIKNTAWLLSKVPLLDKLAEGEDWLAEQARGLSAKLTPDLDPRFAGWGTRIATGLIADKGIRKALPVIRQAGKGVGLTKAVLSRADDATSTAVRAGVPSTLDALNMLDKRRELGMTMMARLDGPNEDIFGPLARATRSAAPVPAWGPDVTDVPINPKSLAREVYDQSQEFMEASLSTVDRYKGGGYGKGLSEWTRQVFEPLMKLAEEKTGQNMYSLLATHPGFKYIEHRIAKTPKLEWFWRRFGDNIAGTSNADDISNLRILLNDRYKALKDAVEAQIYGKSRGRGGDPVKGINDSIKKHSERYIVDVENPQLGGRHLSMEHNPGNLVIRKAGTGEVVGMIGEYYEVLYSNTKQLAERLPIKFKKWRDLTPKQLETKVREWRKQIITDHLDIIRKKEAALQGLNNEQRILKINEALFDDMIEFREKYKGILPELTEGVWRKLSEDGISEFMKETPQRVYTGGLRIDKRRTNPYYPERIDL